jgi:hypothetical protein
MPDIGASEFNTSVNIVRQSQETTFLGEEGEDPSLHSDSFTYYAMLLSLQCF